MICWKTFLFKSSGRTRLLPRCSIQLSRDVLVREPERSRPLPTPSSSAAGWTWTDSESQPHCDLGDHEVFFFLNMGHSRPLFGFIFHIFELQLIMITRYFTDIVGDRKIGKKREVTLIDKSHLIGKKNARRPARIDWPHLKQKKPRFKTGALPGFEPGLLTLDFTILATDIYSPPTGTGKLQQCPELQCRKILLPVLSIQIQQSQGY